MLVKVSDDEKELVMSYDDFFPLEVDPSFEETILLPMIPLGSPAAPYTIIAHALLH